MKLNCKKQLKTSGFTLIEFVVVIAIFSILSAISVFNYQGFQSDAYLKNLAYDIALSLRQAQTFGIAGSNPTDPLGPTSIPEDDSATHGVYFEDSTTFILFQDNDGNNFFSSVTDTILETKTIATGRTIVDICVIESIEACTSVVGNLVVTFERPFADAIIRINNSATAYAYARIDVQSSTDVSAERSVEVWATGAIGVSN